MVVYTKYNYTTFKCSILRKYFKNLEFIFEVYILRVLSWHDNCLVLSYIRSEFKFCSYSFAS